MKKIIRIVFDIAHWCRKLYWKTFKVKTQGARMIVLDDQKVFLVKHRYGNLWVFPGGGVKKGENLEEVAVREVFEETEIVVNSIKQKLGTYTNKQEGRDDTLTIFVTTDWQTGGKLNLFEKFMKVFEIKESGWFDIHNLPGDVSGASRRRMEEYLSDSNVEYTERW